MTLTALVFVALLGPADTASGGPVNPGAVADLRSRSENYIRGGNLTGALQVLEAAAAMTRGQDGETMKRLAEVSQWVRAYGDARERLSDVLRTSPDDAEASAALTSLRLRRSLQVLGSAGGNEVDYATRANELGGFVGWVDWLDLYGGYSTVDRIFYRRKTSWADAYAFPDYRFSLRAGYRSNVYEYPVSINSTPDRNAYRHVPEYQLEGAYAYGEHNAVSLELEYFRPDFYWNGALHANNLKATVTAGHALFGPLFGRVFVALLKDPDPASFDADPLTGGVRSFGYETLSLAGGALGLDDGALSGEIQYVPDRDLDRSIRWSLFGRLRYDFGFLRVQYDVVYDTYGETAGRGFSASRVNMISVVYSPFPSLELRPGAKILSKETTQVAPFVSVRIKTGI